MYTLREKNRVNAGWVVTSSFFPSGARQLQKEYNWLLSLKDKNDLTNWCKNYGQWHQTDKSGLWLPNNPLL
jgi:hypothetical protein